MGRHLTIILSLAFIIASCGRGDGSNDPTATVPSPATDSVGKAKTGTSRNPLDSLPPIPSYRLGNLEAISSRHNLQGRYDAGHRGCNSTIAVLDNGFFGYKEELGKTLPPKTTFSEKRAPAGIPENHGLRMAQIAYAVATGSDRYDPDIEGPKVELISANGYTNFVAAVDRLVELALEIKSQRDNPSSTCPGVPQLHIVYSQIWEFGGNGNGKGFINDQINRAINAGVDPVSLEEWATMYVSAGNYGKASVELPIKVDAQGKVELPHQGRYVRFYNPHDGLPPRIVLAWNDFDRSKHYRTTQDLQLFVEDAQGNKVAESTRIQDGQDHGNDRKYSAHAREIISNTPLKRGIYYIRVDAESTNFQPNSRLWITAYGPGVFMIDRTVSNSIFMPADNPRVVTIGATDVDYSSHRRVTASERPKPELSTFSEVVFTKDQEPVEQDHESPSQGESWPAIERYMGTSTANAIAVGIAANLQSSSKKHLDRKSILELVDQRQLVARPGHKRSRTECLEGRDCQDIPVFEPPVIHLQGTGLSTISSYRP